VAKQSAVEIVRPESSEFPELIVTVPDAWPHVKLAPWYDVHHGHHLHADAMFKRHRTWFLREPHVLSWNGGDFFENAVIGSPGIWDQQAIPQVQFTESVDILGPMKSKLLFAIPGNHEARTFRVSGFDIAAALADKIGIPYFPDYCFCTIKWRGMKFRICAHHGTGAAASPGGQRNAARKDMPWVGADLYWTGHLHQPIADVVYRADYDQKTDRMVSRSSVVIISPSYLRYFGGYAAAKRLSPGALGLTVAVLQDNGNIEVSVHAKGTRL
jgi:hypothetical protein